MPPFVRHVPVIASAATFDPSTLSPTGWWRGSYSGSPWVKTSTTGANLTQPTGTLTPATGAAVDTFTSADCDGTDDYLMESTNGFSWYIAASAGTILIPFRADVASAAAANLYDDPSLLSDTNNAFSMTFSSGGVGVAFYDGASWKGTRVAASATAWHMAKVRWNGSSVEVGVDSGAMSSTASSSLAVAVSNMSVGRAIISASAYFNGQIMEVFMKDTTLTNADISNYYSYLKARYPSAGFP